MTHIKSDDDNRPTLRYLISKISLLDPSCENVVEEIINHSYKGDLLDIDGGIFSSDLVTTEYILEVLKEGDSLLEKAALKVKEQDGIAELIDTIELPINLALLSGIHLTARGHVKETPVDARKALQIILSVTVFYRNLAMLLFAEKTPFQTSVAIYDLYSKISDKLQDYVRYTEGLDDERKTSEGS